MRPTGASAIRLLLIEDSFELVEQLTKLLSANRSAKFSVRATNCLKQGLRAATRGGLDAVLLDLNLPDSVGGETFRKLRAAVPTLPIIILSGTDDEELAVKLVQEGAQDYFIKGEGDAHLLPRAIRYAIERWRIEQALEAERNLLRDVLNALPDIVYVRALDGSYVIANTAHVRFLGVQHPEDVVGRTPADFLRAKHAAAAAVDDDSIISTGVPVIGRIDTCQGNAGDPPRRFSTSKVPLSDSCGEVIGVVGCLHDVTDEKEAEEALHASKRQLHALAAKLEAVREGDRTRIARELHDCIGQHLAVLRMSMGGLCATWPSLPAAVRQKLTGMQELVDAAIASVRTICADLRPPILDELGIAAAIEWQAGQFGQRSGLNCRFVAHGELQTDPARSTALYRIAQESLTNVLRHAEAKNIQIELRGAGGHLELTICDDGRGIREDEIAQKRSLGLLGMRERVEEFGGQFAISGAPRKGTVVSVRMPSGEREK